MTMHDEADPVLAPHLDPLAVPTAVVASALAAFDVFDPGAATASLVRDEVDHVGAGGPRVLTFAGGGVRVVARVLPDRGLLLEATATAAGDDVEILEVRSRTPVETQVERTSPSCWDVRPVPTGPVSVSLRLGAGVVNTEWTVLARRPDGVLRG